MEPDRVSLVVQGLQAVYVLGLGDQVSVSRVYGLGASEGPEVSGAPGATFEVQGFVAWHAGTHCSKSLMTGFSCLATALEERISSCSL